MNKIYITENQRNKLYKRLLSENNNGYYRPLTGAKYKNGNSTNDKHLTIYHDATYEAINNIMKNGFEPYFIGKHVGTAYGRGIYTTLNLSSCQASDNHRLYGPLIVKGILTSAYGFLILDKSLSKEIYGTSDYLEQVRIILPEDEFNKFQNSHLLGVLTHDYGEATHRGKKVDNPSVRRTGPIAINFAKSDYDKYFKGYIFHGENDGFVCFVKDSKSLYPLEYSKDNGNTWIRPSNMISNMKKEINDADVEYMLSLMPNNTYTPIDIFLINGYARIKNSNGINYIDKNGNMMIKGKKLLSDATSFSSNGIAKIVYNGKNMFLKTNGSVWQLSNDGKLEKIANNINSIDAETKFVNSLPDDW